MQTVIRKLGRLSDLPFQKQAELERTQMKKWDEAIECRRSNEKLRVATVRRHRNEKTAGLSSVIVSTLEDLRRSLPKVRKDEDFTVSKRVVQDIRDRRGERLHLSAPIGELLRNAR